MVYHNTIKYPIPDARYSDETWRAKHHFKEEHQHDAPLRRSRDFKPVPWGTARGMPNYRHSEPWLNMKNMYTLMDEHHHHPTKWFKKACFGALFGFINGQIWFAVAPINGFAASKLFAAVGEKPWSGRTYRMLKHTAPRHMAMGVGVFLGYDLIMEFLRHHDETNKRPKIVDHLFAMSVIGTVGGLLATNTPRGAFQGFLWFGIQIGFCTHWIMEMGTYPGASLAKPVSFHYDADVTKEEKERIEMIDQLDILTYNLSKDPGYGMIQINQKW